MDAKKANNYIKDTFLTTICSEKRRATLSAKSWRKGWSNWAQEHEDPETNQIAARIMCHSANVKTSNHAVVNTGKSA